MSLEKIENMTQEELEVVISVLDSRGALLRQHIENHFKALEPLIDSLRELQGKRDRIVSERVRAI